MKTIPDSNVILDVFQRDRDWFEWSWKRLQSSREEGQLVVNTVVFAETSGHFLAYQELHKALRTVGIELEDVPWEAAYAAGRAHRAYRRSGGRRERVLADFLIGAHAAVKGYRILTRDHARYRSYFPDLDIIAPDTHP
jgi:hypothetical protein